MSEVKYYRRGWRWTFYVSAFMLLVLVYGIINNHSYMLLGIVCFFLLVDLSCYFAEVFSVDEDGVKCGARVSAKTLHWRDIKSIECTRFPNVIRVRTHYEAPVFSDTTPRFIVWLGSGFSKWRHSYTYNLAFIADSDELITELEQKAAAYGKDIELDIKPQPAKTVWNNIRANWRPVWANLYLVGFVGALLGFEIYIAGVVRSTEIYERPIVEVAEKQLALHRDVPDDENAGVMFEAAALSLRGMDGKIIGRILESKDAILPEDLAWAQEFIKKNDCAFKLMNEAALRPRVYFRESSFEKIGHFKFTRINIACLLRLYRLSAFVGAKTNQPELATKRVIGAFDVARILSEDNSEDMALSWSFIASNSAIDALQIVLSETALSEKSFEQIKSCIMRELQTRSMNDCVDVLRNREYFYHKELMKELKTSLDFWMSMDLRGSRGLAPPVGALMIAFSKMRAYRAIAEMKEYVGVDPALKFDKTVVEILENMDDSFLPAIWFIQSPAHYLSYLKNTAQLRTALGAIQVELFRQKTGALPKDASELGGEFPEDVFSDEKLIYTKTDSGYRVYSAYNRHLIEGAALAEELDTSRVVLFEVE